MMSGPPDLASGALLQMFLNVCIHSGQLVALGNAFSSFGYSIVSGKHRAVSICKNLVDEFPREIKHS